MTADQPAVGDQLASELAAASMPTLLAEIEAVLSGEVERMEDLAAEADAGGDHPTAARIRAAMEPDQECA
jgi:hypothetical protein